MRRLLAFLTRLAVRRRTTIIGLYAVLVPVALALAGSVVPQLEAGGFEDPNRESWQAFETMQTEFGAGTGDIIALYTTDAESVYDIRVTAQILAIVARLEEEPGVGAVQSLYSTGAPHFASIDGRSTYLVVDLFGDEQEKINLFERLVPLFSSESLTARFAGLIPTNVAVFQTVQRDLARAEVLALPLTFLVALAIFGSPAAVSIVFVTGVSSIVLALASLRAIIVFTDVSVFAINTIVLLGLGLAVDYSLFLVTRYREELAAANVVDAIQRTMETTGRACVVSAVTIAASLCGLFVFDQMVLRSLALGGIVVVLGTVTLSLTLVPALLVAIGADIDRWRFSFLGSETDAQVTRSLWYRVANAVMKQPLPVVFLTATLLLSLALPFTRFSGTIVDWRVLPAGEPVRATSERLATEFTPNQATPHLVLATTPGDVLVPENLERLAVLAERMAALPGIARVDSVFTYVADMSIAEMRQQLLGDYVGNAQIEALVDAFVQGQRMRFALIPEQAFDDPQTLDQVHALRALSTAATRVEVAGYAAALVDLRAAVQERAPWMVLIVITVSMIALFLAFDSVVLPLKAIVLSALSLTASFGAIVWIFQDGRFPLLLDYTPLGFSDSTLPLVMFAIVFGLSMDYEVILLSRVREEYLRCHDNSRAVALGLARTGRLISSAGLLFLVVVAAFATSTIVFMKALGVGMALAILLDITVVRALLVPASMRLLGRWNWYAPECLRRLLRRVRVNAHADRR